MIKLKLLSFPSCQYIGLIYPRVVYYESTYENKIN